MAWSLHCNYMCCSVQVDLHSPWWVEALQNTATKGMEGDLCQRIKDELSSTATEMGSIGRCVVMVFLAIRHNYSVKDLNPGIIL